MKIRGDLKVLRDLIVKTAAADAEVGKLLYAGASDGTVIWSDLIVHDAKSRAYKRGSLVFNQAGTKVYIANVDGASGIDLDSLKWTEISGGSGSGSGDSVVTYDNKADMEAVEGKENTIYIVAETNSLYRWDPSNSSYINIVGTQNAVKASIDVGGIKKNDPILEGTTLEVFIKQLVNPEVEAVVVSSQSYSFGINNIPSKRIGTTFNLSYNNNYSPGRVKGYDLAGAEVVYDLKSSSATYTHSPILAASYSVRETNSFNGRATYTKGTPPVYTSVGNLSTVDRSGGTMDSTFSFIGHYEVYVGMAATDSNAVVSQIQNGTLPSHTFTTVEYVANSQKTVPVVLRKDLASIYVAMPKNKFTKFMVKSSTFDTIITEDDYVQDFDVSVDGNVTAMKLYTVDMNGYDSDMNADLIINI